MKKLLVLASFFALVLIPVAARAGQNAVALSSDVAASVPVVDTFVDGDQRLRLVGLPSPAGERFQVTLVYEDTDQQALRSVTIDPALATTTNAADLNAFLAQMDPGFLSFVRASLADRLLHLKATPNGFDRAESVLFFPRVARDARVAHNAAEAEGNAE